MSNEIYHYPFPFLKIWFYIKFGAKNWSQKLIINC
jgi:hypothetical protein